MHRNREHTEALIEELELGNLWDEYGLVGDLVVLASLLASYLRLTHHPSLSQMIFHEQTFMSLWHQTYFIS